MNIELGKNSRTRVGRKVNCIYVSDKRDQDNYLMTDGIVAFWFYEDGKYNFGCNPHENDIISEWVDKPEMDRSVLPAWANKAVAMDVDGEWFCFGCEPRQGEFYWTTNNECYGIIPDSHAPKWKGDWKDSLLVFED